MQAIVFKGNKNAFFPLQTEKTVVEYIYKMKKDGENYGKS